MCSLSSNNGRFFINGQDSHSHDHCSRMAVHNCPGCFSLLLLVLLAHTYVLAFLHVPPVSSSPTIQRAASSSARKQSLAAAPLVIPSSSLLSLSSTINPEDEPNNSGPNDADIAPAVSSSSDQGQPVSSGAAVGPCKNFPKCDGAMRNRGCDGSGKIQGGIATFPLLGWWPIKVKNVNRCQSYAR